MAGGYGPLAVAAVRAEKDVRAICERARRQVVATVQARLDRGGSPALAGQLLLTLEKSISAIYKAMGKRIAQSFRRSLSEEMRKAYDEAAKAVKADRARAQVIGAVDVATINRRLQGTYTQIAGRTQMMADEHVMHLRNVSAEGLRIAALTGETRAEATRRIKAKALEVPGFQFTARNGAKWKHEAYFSMLARTEMMKAAHDAIDEKSAEMGYDVAKIVDSAPDCKACAKYAGVLFSITGITQGVPSKADLEADGVFHPNCRCTYVPVSDYELHEMGRDDLIREREELKEERDERD